MKLRSGLLFLVFAFTLCLLLVIGNVTRTAVSAGPLSSPPISLPAMPKVALYGRISDEQGHANSSWQVQIVRPDEKIADAVSLDVQGFYHTRPLPGGFYRLRVLDDTGQELLLTAGNDATITPQQMQEQPERNLIVRSLAVVENGRSPAAIQGTGQITGVVTAADTGLPLSLVYVRAYSLDGFYADGDFTDSDGQYMLVDLDTGSYKVNFDDYSNSDYAPEWYDNQPNSDSANPVSVTDGAITANINAMLDIGGKISGQVTAADTGLSLEDVWVRVYDGSDDQVDTAYPDANGLYTTTALFSDNYRLQFDPYDTADAYLPEYYNDKPDLKTADPVSVTAPAVVMIDAALTRSSQITGHVTAADSGLPLADVRVTAYRRDECDDFIWAAAATTDADGLYTLTPLTSASYYLSFVPLSNSEAAAYLPEYFDDKPDLETADPIPVTTPNVVSDVDAALTPGSQIGGVVTAADTMLPLDDVSAALYDEEGYYIASFSTEANGVYTSTAVATGTYYLRFNPSIFGESKAYLAEYYNDKPGFSSADPIVITTPGLHDGFDAVLARGGQIAGQVTAVDTSLPLSDLSVQVYNEDGYYVTSAFPDNDGNYTTPGLVSGSYRLYFSPYSSGDARDYIREYYNDKPDLETADPIPVTTPNLVSNINAALTPGGKIMGQVTAVDSGAPIANVDVNAYDSQDRLVTDDSTDTSGNYAITGLPTGNYRLYFYYTIPLDYGCSTIYFHVTEYYDDKPDLETGDPVSVTAPNTVSGIDADLPLPGPFNFSAYLPIILRD